MHYKYLPLTFLIIGSICTIIMIHKSQKKNSLDTSLKIGILQTASHPALDAAQKGFIDILKNHFNDHVRFVIRNAQGSTIDAHMIAEHFHADNSIKGIYAIGTPALQAIASIEKKKPIFIAAVSNPNELEVLRDMTNIWGTTDMINIPETIKSMISILPHITSVALIYNPSEINAVAQVSIIQKELIYYGIKPINVGIATETDIPQAVAKALSRADVLLTPTDNLIASAMPLIAKLARYAKKPLIASHNLAVEQGALMARGVDYYTSGKETGEIALSVLQNEKTSHTLSIKPSQSDTIVINKQILDELNIVISDMSDKIILINNDK